MKDDFWLYAMAVFVALCVGASCLSIRAQAKDYHHHDEMTCEDVRECMPKRDCLSGYDWVWFVAINTKCDAAQRWHIDDPGRRFRLCYADHDGNVFLWKQLRFQPFAEMQFEADMRNQAQCR